MGDYNGWNGVQNAYVIVYQHENVYQHEKLDRSSDQTICTAYKPKNSRKTTHTFYKAENHLIRIVN